MCAWWRPGRSWRRSRTRSPGSGPWGPGGCRARSPGSAGRAGPPTSRCARPSGSTARARSRSCSSDQVPAPAANRGAEPDGRFRAVARYAAALSQHPVPAHAVGETAGQIMDALDGDDPDLVVCFASPHFVGAFEDVAHALRQLLSPVVLLGGTAVSVIGGALEIEEEAALSVFAAAFDDATLTPVALRVEDTPDGAAVVGWPELDHEPSTLLLFAEPFSFPVDGFLRRLNEDRPELTVIGGLASAGGRPGANRLVLDEAVL